MIRTSPTRADRPDVRYTGVTQGRRDALLANAEFVEREGRQGYKLYMRITPTISWSMNLEPTEGDGGRPAVHRTVHG